MYSYLYRIFNVTNEFFYFRGFIVLLAILALYRAIKDPVPKKLRRLRGLALFLICSSIFDIFIFPYREFLKWSVELPTIVIGVLLYLKALKADSSSKLSYIKFHLSSLGTSSFITLSIIWFFLVPWFGGHSHIHQPFLKQAIEPQLIPILLEGERCSCEMGDRGWFLFKGSIGEGELFVYNGGILEKLTLTVKTKVGDDPTYMTYANEYLSFPFKCTEAFEKTDGDCDAQLSEDNCNLEKVFTCDLKIKDLKTRGESKLYSGLKSKCKCR